MNWIRLVDQKPPYKEDLWIAQIDSEGNYYTVCEPFFLLEKYYNGKEAFMNSFGEREVAFEYDEITHWMPFKYPDDPESFDRGNNAQGKEKTNLLPT